MDPQRHKITTTYDKSHQMLNVQAYDRSSGEMVGRLEGSPNEFIDHTFMGDFDVPSAYSDDSGRPQAQGAMFTTRPGEADMMAVKADHQGTGLGRAMVQALGHHLGDTRPSDELSPDSAGVLGHLGIDHLSPTMLTGDTDKGARNVWARDAVDARSWEMNDAHNHTWRGFDPRTTERDATHLAQITPRALGGDTPAHFQSPQFSGVIAGQQRLPGVP